MRPADIKKRALHLLHLDESPHLLAKSFAVGVFIAFTPFMGLHTIAVLLLAWALRLNKAAAILGTLVNNPWTIAALFIGPTYAAAVAMRWFGIDVPPMGFGHLTRRLDMVMDLYSPWQVKFWMLLIKTFRPYIVALLVGTTVAGAAASVFSYFLTQSWIMRHREARARRQALEAGEAVKE